MSNEKTTQVIVELIEKASNGIDSAVAFSQQQIPEVVDQLLVWKMVSSIVLQVLGIFIVIVACLLWRFGAKAYKNGESWTVVDGYENITSEIYDWISGPCMLILSFVGFGMAGYGTMISLKIWLAPKLYLLEYAVSLVK